MHSILSLPVELLEEIYHNLGSIDDVHHFGRTCKATFEPIRLQTGYNRIMRYIIDLHRTIVHQYTYVQPHPVPAMRPDPDPRSSVFFNSFENQLVTAVTSECPNGPCTTCLPDTRLHEILARYQGLRILEDQWLTRQLSKFDLVPVDSSMDGNGLLNLYRSACEREEDFRNKQVATRTSKNMEAYTSFVSDQRGRFHCAIVSLWLFNEIRWVLAQFRFPSSTFVLQIRLLEVCKRWILNKTATSIVEELDRYAMFSFLYQHLLPVHGSFLADRGSWKLPLTFPSNLEKCPWYCIRFLQLFLLAGQTYMQPPDIIDLLVRQRISRKPPYPPLILPRTTSKYQIPSTAFQYPPNLDYANPRTFSPASISTVRILMRNATMHFNIIGRATIYQSEAHPNSHWVDDPILTEGLFNVVDDMNAWLREKALVAFDVAQRSKERVPGYLVKVMEDLFDEEWEDVWWSVWWWANSQEKAEMKMERWREVENDESDITNDENDEGSD